MASQMSWSSIIADLESHSVCFEAGLTADEVTRIEKILRVRLPVDLRSFLQTALPVSGGFIDWRSERLHRSLLETPIEGLLFDVEHNDFWLKDWGARPGDGNKAVKQAAPSVRRAPPLIPIRDDDFLPAARRSERDFNTTGPVLELRQSEIRPVASSLSDYLRSERAKPKPPSPIDLKLPFWDAVISASAVSIPNLHASAPCLDSEIYRSVCDAIIEAGYFAEVHDDPRNWITVDVKVREPKSADDDRIGGFWCTKFDFGWIVCLWGPRLFTLTTSDAIVGLSLDLLSGVRPSTPPSMSDEIRKRYGLTALSARQVNKDEWRAIRQRHESLGWRELTDRNEDLAWERCFPVLGHPYDRDPDPSAPPENERKWDIKSRWRYDSEARHTVEWDLSQKTLMALRAVTPNGAEIYVLDWNHPCYAFDPHTFRPSSQDDWPIPVFPDGDSYFFVDQSVTLGIVADYVDDTIRVFGSSLIAALANDVPQLFAESNRTTGS